MSRILYILSQYSILEITSQYLSLLDLFRLAITCSKLYAVIRKSDATFNYLKRLALCDGRGLKARQEFRGLYATNRPEWGRPDFDEELEVRVWNLKCDALNALPCLKCGLNVCEECRYVPRVAYTPEEGSRQRPHHDTGFRGHTIICFCTACDTKVEQELPLRLSELCDCDQYTRWICLTCRMDEERLDCEYLETRTQLYWPDEGDDHEGWLSRVANNFSLEAAPERRAFWCLCGEISPKDCHIRCAWCKRKHDRAQWQFGLDYITPFDHDPCYPQRPVTNPQTRLLEYATLGYTGPIYGQTAG